jgi:serine/threonine-protein kinase
MRAACLAGLVLLVLVLSAGCGGDRVLMLPAWSLDAGGATTTVVLPAHFEARVGAGPAAYTLRTTALLPPDLRDRALTLAIPHFAARASLRANGLEAPELEASPLERYRGLGPRLFLVPADATRADTLDLELAVDHRWTQSAWLDTVPRLSADRGGDSGFTAVTAFRSASASAGLAMLVLVAVAYGVVFLADRRRAVFGWFALESLGLASYPAFVLGLTQPLLGPLDVPVMGVLVCAAAVCSVRFTGSLSGRRVSPLWWAPAGATLAIAVFARGPFESTRWLAPPTILTMLLALGYHARLLREALRTRRPAALLATMGWPLVCVAALGDFVGWLGLGELPLGPVASLRGGCAGLAVLSLLQALALSAELMDSLRRADALNVELRRQIGARSQQLAETLARVGSVRLPVLALTPGDVVEDRYRVRRFVGSGGMAWIYEVERIPDGRRLALKLLHGHAKGPAVARFAGEARLASEIAHPAIVSVVDVDLTSDGVLFLVMEYVDGKSLEQRLDHDDPPIAWSLSVLRQIAEGLEQVHARGIVHRDLKPANVLIADGQDGPVAKIVDFGVAALRAEQDGEARAARGGRVLGTPMYMAPELADDAAPPDVSADMFSFGVMAHELLVGRPPFRDPLFVRRLHGRSLPPAPPLAAVRPRIDRSVASLIDRCVELAPEARPSAAEAARILRAARAAEPDPSSAPSVKTARAFPT